MYFPAGVAVEVLIFMLEEPGPGAGMVFGLKLTGTRKGWPDALSEIGELKPPYAVLSMVIVVEDPGATITELGVNLIEKVGRVTYTFVVWVTPPPVPVTIMV